MGEGNNRVARGAYVREIDEQRRRETLLGGRNRAERNLEEPEAVGTEPELGRGSDRAGDDVPEIHVRLLPQLRARLLLLASRFGLRLLLQLAGDFVLQGLQRDLALAAEMPGVAGEMQPRIPVVLPHSSAPCFCLNRS